ncbi:MAG: peptide ABC transporter substrate-binding protein [Patescibacteria group bacterium]
MIFGLIKLFKSFSRKEIIVFVVLFLAFLVSASLLLAKFISVNTKILAVSGGKYAEGAVGQPAFVNPVLASTDVDRDLVELIFSDLERMAENYKSDETGKIWRYRLKENLFWHDNRPITSDDIIFTIEAIKNPDSYSPLFISWQGVSVNRISEREIEFKLPGSYVFFKDALRGLKPIPKHIFADIPAANFRLSNYNLEPIGSGPFKFAGFKKKSDGYIVSYDLAKNENYFGDKAYLDGFSFVFYTDESSLVKAFNMGIIDGLGNVSKESLGKINFPSKIFSFRMLKYYAIFLNPYAQQGLKDKNVKMALSLAIDKNKIIEKSFGRYAVPVAGPLVDGADGFSSLVYPEEIFSLEKSVQVFEASGWTLGEDNIRQKQFGNELVRLDFNLVVPNNQFLVETANLIKEDWFKAGVKLNLSILPLSSINGDIIKNRDYQMILFGNIIGESPDLFSFWHSSERFYPGYNLALYENKSADNLIELIRKNFNDEKRYSDLASLQSLIIGDQPAFFLYSPNYVYVSKKKLGGLEEYAISLPSDRFKNAEKLFVKTARALK